MDSGAPSAGEHVGGARRLKEALENERNLLASLSTLLDEERAAFLARDTTQIEAISRRKQSALEALAAASDQSRALLAQPHGLQSKQIDIGPECKARLTQLRAAWKAAQVSNQRNSAVMKIHQASVLRGLGVLRQSVGLAETYRADGRAGGHYLSA